MLSWKLSDDPINPALDKGKYLDPEVRKKTRCTIFLGFSSNMMSSGMREIIKFLVQHKMVDVLVTTTGGVEEDFLKVLGSFHSWKFEANDQELWRHRQHRQGNMVLPWDLYKKMDQFSLPIFKEMHQI